MRSTRTSLVLCAVATLLGCGVGLSSRGGPTDVTVAPNAAGSRPKGSVTNVGTVDLTKLDERERAEIVELSDSLFAPCAEQAVSLRACVEESRPCAACQPMFDLVSSLISEGVPKTNVKAAALSRFAAEAQLEVPARTSASVGPADALVTIVTYSDFQCPACKATVPKLEELQRSFPNEVRLEHRFYPLSKHTYSKEAAFAAVAAQNQRKFFAMEKIIFEHQEELSDRDLERYAEEIGLDLAKFRADKAAPETKARVEQDIQDADALGLTHTPFVLINGRQFDPAYFRYDRDLEPWVKTEIELQKQKRASRN